MCRQPTERTVHPAPGTVVGRAGRRAANALTAAAWALSVLVPWASVAAVREDLRACQYGFWKALKTGAAPPATGNRDEQYCLALAYWFQPSPLARDPARARQWHAAAVRQGHIAPRADAGWP